MKFAVRYPWIIVAVCHALAVLVVLEINYYLAPTGISITIVGALIAFSSLKLTLTQGALSVLPIALYFDSKTPLPFGANIVLVLGLHYALALLKLRLKRDTDEILLVVALIANLVVHLFYSFAAASQFGIEQLILSQTLVNLLVSSLAISLLNTGYARTIIETLALFGIARTQPRRRSP